MKTIANKTTLLSIILITMFSYSFVSEKKKFLETKQCLKVIGIALDEKNEPLNGVEIKLFKENEELEFEEITSVPYHDHNFSFVLDKNEYYTIEVTKPGFVKRSIAISTKLPSTVKQKPIFTYGFEVTLLKEKSDLNNYYDDFPVALISYNIKDQIFENHDKYTNYIKSRIKEETEHMLVENMINGK